MELHIVQVGNVLVSPDIFTEKFCCDLHACKGQCCVEGDAGAPVTLDEVGEMENALDEVWGDLSASAQSVIDKQGVAYTDNDGDLVTSIVGGKDCVFTCYRDLDLHDGQPAVPHCCLCAFDCAYREGRTEWRKPISCELYPIREKTFSNGLIGINYHRWSVCKAAVRKGEAEGIRVYEFLKEPLIRRFGQEWYEELCLVARQLLAQ